MSAKGSIENPEPDDGLEEELEVEFPNCVVVTVLVVVETMERTIILVLKPQEIKIYD
jgi:hypothetical protein